MLVWRPFQRRPAQARICHIRNEFASLRLVDGRNSMRSFPMRRGKRLLLRFRRRRAQPMTFPLFPKADVLRSLSDSTTLTWRDRPGPTYSSWSATILLTGLAIVTCGGGGGEACDC